MRPKITKIHAKHKGVTVSIAMRGAYWHYSLTHVKQGSLLFAAITDVAPTTDFMVAYSNLKKLMVRDFSNLLGENNG